MAGLMPAISLYGEIHAPVTVRRIPADVPGRLDLHSTPGRYELLDECWAELDRVGCSIVVCLAPTSRFGKVSGVR